MTAAVPTITGLFHVAVKTSNLQRTRRFYSDIVGLVEVPRPAFDYPGAWFGLPEPGGLAILHVYAGGPALGLDRKVPFGSAAVDHISLSAEGYHQYVQRFQDAGLAWRAFIVPGTDYWQLFVCDPSGVLLELTFDAQVEGGEPPLIAESRRYRAGESFIECPPLAT